jgi:putative ABC transport system substrate-binding protein
LASLRRGLRDLGWIEGQNVTVESRWADGQPERLPALAAELVQIQPNVIVTLAHPVTVAAKGATSTIPIVFAVEGDPVGTRVVASFSRPGGNVTGVSNMAPQLAGKRLELLKEAMPAATRVMAIWNLADQTMASEYGETLVGAEALGIEIQNVGVRTPDDLEGAYQTAVAGRVDAVVVIVDPLLARSQARFVELSTRSQVPTISGDSAFAAAGGLMSYGPNFDRQTERAAYYVDRILNGASPADLPVEQPTKFDFVINLKTAQALRLTIPQHVLLQATEVIQ